MTTIRDVFTAVQSGSADLGVVPFENSTHGVVTFTLDGLADRTGAFADLSVCGEVYLDVHHFLLGYRPGGRREEEEDDDAKHHDEDEDGDDRGSRRGEPLCPLDHVRRVLSHPQALGQTDGFLSSRLGGVERVDVSSTSRAAEMAAADGSGATAAVAGEMAARAFGLDVLARCIEDRDDNTTRFFVLRRRRRRESEEGEGEGEEFGGGERGEQQQQHKTLVSFTVPHRSPGALVRVLDVFSKYGLNLTSINSLPSLIQPFQYLFFVEFEGSLLHDPEARVKSALGEIEKVAEGWRWLGSWKSQR